MSQQDSGLFKENASLLGYLTDHPEASKKLYKLISEMQKERSSQSRSTDMLVCYQRYYEECKQILRHYRNRRSTDTS